MPDPQRVLVVHPHFKNNRHARDPQARLDEAVGLTHAIDLQVVGQISVSMALPRPSTLFGKGKVEELGEIVAELEAGLVVVDSSLSPVQQRNLEKAWQCKVIDRTALILEIFGARARTAEGKLQVELAALNYQKSRLVRSWTHLERQRGGFGFLGGPGESQIEIDRRLIRDRISRLKKELETVTRTRELHRRKRRDVPYPIVALVGYTNAGKSTLFNRLTGAKVLAEDKLFATLDPTMRALRLQSGATVILSDTVGFVSDLPHELVAAFRATLEEVLEADLLLHVRDIAHVDTAAQKADVEAVLKRLFESDSLPENLIEVRNKIDLLNSTLREQEQGTGIVALSAVTGEGIAQLLALLDEQVSASGGIRQSFTLRLDDGRALAWLHAHGKVLEQGEHEGYLHVVAQLSQANAERFRKNILAAL